MTKVIIGANPFDMSSWDLSDLANGTVTSDSATKVAVKGADLLYAITGTDLGSFDAHGFPQSGTVTGLIIETTGHVATKFQDISISASASDFNAAVNTGALSTASFDSDLAAAIGSSQLGVHDAVIFTPNSGTLAGDHFLIVDTNGTAGYQAGQDLVILLDHASSLNLTTANFT